MALPGVDEDKGREAAEPLLGRRETDGSFRGREAAASWPNTEASWSKPFINSSSIGSQQVETARRPVAPSGSTITFWDIGFEVPDRRNRKVKKRLLKDVCGAILPGQVLAIMGPSGCGKTSLLEILGGRNSPTRGGLMANGLLYDDHTKMQVGFVPQEDALFGTLTVAETVLFTAELRLPTRLSQAERMCRVNTVLEELNLLGVRDSLVGDKVRRGISGGERKRVSIARELVYEPTLLLLDEPTSGLDSYTSIKVMRLLRHLAAQRGRTIAASIHQPSSEIFGLFDQLMLLASGRVVYGGPAKAAIGYFQELGLECPRYANPADFFLSACCDESTELPRQGQDPLALTPKQVTERLIQAFQVSSIKAETDVMITQARTAGGLLGPPTSSSTPMTMAAGGRRRSRPSSSSSSSTGADQRPLVLPPPPLRRASSAATKGAGSSSSWWRQFSCLCRRSSLNTRRNPMSSYVIVGRTLVMSLLVGSLYWQIDLGPSGVMDRSGALFFVLTNQVMSSLASLTLLLDEREIVAHESRSSLYPVSAYFVAKQVAELPLQVTMAVVSACITYWMVGFQAQLWRFVCYGCTLVLASLVAESYILVCGSITTSGKVAMVVAPVLLTLFMLFSGFFINSGSIPPYYQWIKYVSFFNYLNVALQKNEFEGLVFQPMGPPGQPPLTGDEVISSLHLLGLSAWSCLGVVAGMTLLFRALAFVFVRINYRPKRFELPPQDDEEEEEEEEEHEEEEDEEAGRRGHASQQRQHYSYYSPPAPLPATTSSSSSAAWPSSSSSSTATSREGEEVKGGDGGQ